MSPFHRPAGRRLGRCRTLGAAALGAALGVMTTAGPLWATAPDAPVRVGVSNLAVFEPGGDAAVERVPSETRVVEARFQHVDATGHDIAVVVKGRGGIDIFRASRALVGDGAASVPIDGTAMFPRLAAVIDGAARDAKRNAKQAATQAVGTQEFLLSVQAGILRATYALTTLGAVHNLPAVDAARVGAAIGQVERAQRRAERAIALPADDVAGKQREANEIDALLGPVVETAGQLMAAAAGASDLALPTTGPGPQDALVVQIHVDGDVAASAELWVTPEPVIFLPMAAR